MSERDTGEVLANLVTRLEEAERRLDKQALVIKALRSRVGALEGATGSTAVGVAGPDMSAIPDAAPIPLPPECLLCREPKGPGRVKIMTCAPCNDKRAAGITAGGEARDAVLIGSCGICGKSLGKSSNLVCAPCRAGINIWKKSL